MLTFRLAQIEDLAGIMRVIHEAQRFMRALNIDQWQDGYPDETIFLEDIKAKQAYVYADSENGRIVSTSVFSLIPEPVYEEIEGTWTIEGRYLTIHRMAICDEDRGSGIANSVLRQALSFAQNSGCACLRTDTHSGNLAMRRFLEKNGFSYAGKVYYNVKAGTPLRVAYEKKV